MQELKRGSKAQRNKIDALRSKLIYLALSIEESVQKVVSKNVADNSAVLSNNAKVPYLENACCNDSDDNTYQYFASREPQINVENNIVKDLRAVLDDVGRMASADPVRPKDTRLIYPEILQSFLRKPYTRHSSYTASTTLIFLSAKSLEPYVWISQISLMCQHQSKRKSGDLEEMGRTSMKTVWHS